MIQDAVYNHVGLYIILPYRIPPNERLVASMAFIHKTNYKDQAMFDPYASAAEKKTDARRMVLPQMPTWIMAIPMWPIILSSMQYGQWKNLALMAGGSTPILTMTLDLWTAVIKHFPMNFPNSPCLAETWVHKVYPTSRTLPRTIIIFLSKATCRPPQIFKLCGALPMRLQKILAGRKVREPFVHHAAGNGFCYKDPPARVIFLDNHDMARFYSVVNENMDKYKCGLAWLLFYLPRHSANVLWRWTGNTQHHFTQWRACAAWFSQRMANRQDQ